MSELIIHPINDSVEICIEMESIADRPIVQDGLVTGAVRQIWTRPITIPTLISELPKDRQDG